MTTAAICATREMSRSPSYYRGEQYDSDLGLYYLRARYYNPATGRFLSRDPLDGNRKEPASPHKYLYANGDPVDLIDPSGRDALMEFTIKLGKFMVEAPNLAALGVETGLCFLAIAAEASNSIKHGGEEVGGLGWAAILAPCTLSYFHLMAFLAVFGT